MSPRKLFAFIRERRRRSAQHSDEEGAQITRRLQELLAVPTPTQEVETQEPLGTYHLLPQTKVMGEVITITPGGDGSGYARRDVQDQQRR